VVAKLENQGTAGSQRVAGIGVAVYGPGAGKLVAGSVGVGASHAEAVETAVAEWVQLAGIAIVRALVLKERSSERYDLGGHIVYPGATGVRGPARPPWSAESQRQLIGRLVPAFKDLNPGELHSVSLAVVVNPGGPIEGECLVNGARSPAVLAAVAAYPWARLKTSYMFKQYYVVEKGR
jgi:hypothetical protein